MLQGTLYMYVPVCSTVKEINSDWLSDAALDDDDLWLLSPHSEILRS